MFIGEPSSPVSNGMHCKYRVFLKKNIDKGCFFSSQIYNYNRWLKLNKDTKESRPSFLNYENK